MISRMILIIGLFTFINIFHAGAAKKGTKNTSLSCQEVIQSQLENRPSPEHKNSSQDLSYNPLLDLSPLDLNAIPFHLIRIENFEEAFDKALALAEQRWEEYLKKASEPSFESIYYVFDKLDSELSYVYKVFNIYYSHLQTKESVELLTKLERKMSSLTSDFNHKVFNNEKLFQDLNFILKKINLSPEQKKIITNLLDVFKNSGFYLDSKGRSQFKETIKKLHLLSAQFDENIIEQNRLENSYYEIRNPKLLEGLPQWFKKRLKANAKELNKPNSWVIHLASETDFYIFMENSHNEKLRKKVMELEFALNSKRTPFDNTQLVKEILLLRLSNSKLLGYKSTSDYYLSKNMVNNPEDVKKFYISFLSKTTEKVKRELAQIQSYKDQITGKQEPLNRWSLLYWKKKYKEDTYRFSEESLRPYLLYEKVLSGAFAIIKNLFHIELNLRTDLPVFHPDVSVYEVSRFGKKIGLLYLDPFERDGKTQGAWSNSFQLEEKSTDGSSLPIINIILTNFQKEPKEKAYLSVSDATTLLHELGHAIHTFASDVPYRFLSGTDGTTLDFVELPSQFMENFFYEVTFLKQFTTNDRGEPPPDHLIEGLIESKNFGLGFMMLSQLLMMRADIEPHSLTDFPKDFNLVEYQKIINEGFSIWPEERDIPRDLYNRFRHIITGGYSSQYYSYLWSEVLSTDAFYYFKESGDIFNPEISQKFYELLSRGGILPEDENYRLFRGKDPSNEAYFKSKGF